MKFSFNQFTKFGTKNGSYSIVTEREYIDSQITATDAEADLLLNYFGPSNITIGNVKSNPQLSRKEFCLYPSGKKIYLNLVFPKPEKHELRLYIASRAGFKPLPHSIWFLFVKNGKIWIGSLNEKVWRMENSILLLDESDQFYQDNIIETDKIKSSHLTAKDIFSRDRKKAIKRMELEKYHCEYDVKHNLFISRGTKFPYLEAHHLIPISLQKSLKTNLDLLENIYCLCPFCHRAIHHAEVDCTKKIIDKLINKRHKILDHLKIGQSDLYQIYAVEEII